MTKIIYPEQSCQFIGSCFNVYLELGCEFFEAVYQESLEIEYERFAFTKKRKKKIAKINIISGYLNESN
jgi:hypothetical protein